MWWLIFSITLSVHPISSTAGKLQVLPIRSTKHLPTPKGIIDTVYFEDFEEGAPGWQLIDYTDIGPKWHPDTFHAYGGTGKSWWMGDPQIGGYLDHWYQVLDSPELTLPSGTIYLTFVMRRGIEEPANYQQYDGWDGCNVRISTDGGNTWTVIEPDYPEYNCSSLYSFGYEHGEGPGVPGWGGSSPGFDWEAVQFNLSDYAGQTVKIRWAFASDPGYCTTDDPTLFGWQIDNIDIAGVFSSNAEGNDTLQFTRASLVPVAGQIWHLAEDPTAPSPIHIMSCDTNGTYLPNLVDAMVSPFIHLPEVEEIYATFYLKGNMNDRDQFPNVDYFAFQLSPDGTQWFYISNPNGDPDDINYVYLLTDASEWFSFIEGYSESWDEDIAVYAGDSVQFRIVVYSDEDEPIGEGMKVDNFLVWVVRMLCPPYGLYATAGDRLITLNWHPPIPGTPAILAYDNEPRYYINDAQPYAVRFTPESYPAMLMQAMVDLYGSPAFSGTYSLYVWDDDGANGMPGTQLLQIDGLVVEHPYIGFETIDLSPYGIVIEDGDYYIGVGNFAQGDQGLLVDTFPAQNRSYCYYGGQWYPLTDAYETVTNLLIRSKVIQYEPGAEPADSFRIYRKEEAGTYSPIATTVDTFYQDTDVENDHTYWYYVTAFFGTSETPPSNEVSATPFSLTTVDICYDDGIPDGGYTIGSGNYMAVRFTPPEYPVGITKIRYYLTSGPGNFIGYIWDDDGEDGLPGTQLYQANFIGATEGWNEHILDSMLVITDGDFYVGLRALTTTPPLGYDTTAPFDDRSYYKVGDEPWELFSDAGLYYDLMIRATVDTHAVGVEEVARTEILSIKLANSIIGDYVHATVTVPGMQDFAITLHNVMGQKLSTPVTIRNMGDHYDVTIGVANLPTGIYFITVRSHDSSVITKVVKLR